MKLPLIDALDLRAVTICKTFVTRWEAEAWRLMSVVNNGRETSIPITYDVITLAAAEFFGVRPQDVTCDQFRNLNEKMY